VAPSRGGSGDAEPPLGSFWASMGLVQIQGENNRGGGVRLDLTDPTRGQGGKLCYTAQLGAGVFET